MKATLCGVALLTTVAQLALIVQGCSGGEATNPSQDVQEANEQHVQGSRRGGGATNSVREVLLHTENLLQTVRSNMTSEIRQCIGNPLLTTNELVQLRNAIMQLQEESLRAGIGIQLSNAEERVKAAAVGKATNLEDRIAFRFNEQDFISRIKTQEAANESLKRDLNNAVQALNGSVEAATPVQDVLTDAELSNCIATRLQWLLGELEKSGTEAQTNSVEAGIGDKKVNPGGLANDNLPSNISPNVRKVITMAQVGIKDQEILRFIASSSEPFGLNTADQIIAAKQEGLSDKVLCAMLQRDRFFRSKATTLEAVKP